MQIGRFHWFVNNCIRKRLCETSDEEETERKDVGESPENVLFPENTVKYTYTL